MKIRKYLTRFFSFLLISSTLVIYSCEPEYCASCYDYSLIFRDKVITVCADNLDDLYWLMDESEYLGYECQEDW